MTRYNYPIWQDKAATTTAHVYILKNNQWVDTGRHFSIMPGGNAPSFWLNQIGEDYVKSKEPSFGLLTLYNAYTETQPDAYQVFKTDVNNTEYGFYNDWSYEQYTDTGHCQNAPVNSHADARQILTYGRWGVSGDSIVVKELIRPIITATPNQLYLGAEDTYVQTIVIQSNKVGELIVPEWLNVSQTSITVGTNTIYVSVNENTGWNNRDGNIIVKCEAYWEDDYDYAPVVYINQAGIVPYFSVYPVEQSFGWNSGTTVFLVHTNVPYSATTNQSWLTYAGSSPATVHAYNAAFNVSANTSDDRQATITFTYKTSSATTATTSVILRQAHAPHLVITPTSRQVDAGSNSIRISVDSEADWYIVDKPSWITGPSSGVSGVTLIYINVEANLSELRSGSVVFSNIARQATFSVTQEPPMAVIYTANRKLSNLTNNNFGAEIISHDFSWDESETWGMGVIYFATDPTKVSGLNDLSGYTKLYSIKVPNSVTSIENDAFKNDGYLSSITVYTGITTIGDNAFSGCTSLTYAPVPNTVTSIGDYAFAGCTGITAVNLSDNNLDYIHMGTFSHCTSLTSVTLPDTITQICYNAFDYCAFTSITIPDSVTSIGGISPTNRSDPYFTSTSGYFYQFGQTGAFQNCTQLREISLPSGLTYLGQLSFAGCNHLQSAITIPASCVRIGPAVFSGSSVQVMDLLFEGTDYGNNCCAYGGTYQYALATLGWSNGVIKVKDHTVFLDGLFNDEYLDGTHHFGNDPENIYYPRVEYKNPPVVPNNAIYYTAARNYRYFYLPKENYRNSIIYIECDMDSWARRSEGVIEYADTSVTITNINPSFFPWASDSACWFNPNQYFFLTTIAFPNSLTSLSMNLYTNKNGTYRPVNIGTMYLGDNISSITLNYLSTYQSYMKPHIYYAGTKAQWALVTKSIPPLSTVHCSDGIYGS